MMRACKKKSHNVSSFNVLKLFISANIVAHSYIHTYIYIELKKKKFKKYIYTLIN